MAFLEGVQEGEEIYAWLKRTPSRAIRSKVGVLTTGSPYAPAWGQPQSSAMANKMLGRFAGSSCLQPVNRTPANRKLVKIRFFLSIGEGIFKVNECLRLQLTQSSSVLLIFHPIWSWEWSDCIESLIVFKDIGIRTNLTGIFGFS